MWRRPMNRDFFKKLHTITLVGAAGTALIASFPVPAISYNSHVTDSVTDNGNGTWTYDFTVFNDEPNFYGYGFDTEAVAPRETATVQAAMDTTGEIHVIVDWELPYFDDMGITNIQSPENWFYSIETIGVPNATTGWQGTAAWQQDGDPWKDHFDQVYGGADNNPFNNNTKVLHWYTTSNEIWPQMSLSGFSFTAVFDEGNAPYQTSWNAKEIFTGDPNFPNAGLPNSPSINPVPLPGTLTLLFAGAGGLAILRKKKKDR